MLAPDDLRHLRPATGSDQNVFGTKLLVADQTVWASSRVARTAHHMHLRQQPLRRCHSAAGFPGAVGLQRLPVESRVTHRPAKTNAPSAKDLAEVVRK